MPFKKGQSGNVSGKPKGAKNKKTEQWELFADFCLNEGLEKFATELKTLKGEKYCNTFIGLLEFHKPKLARTQTEIEVTDNSIHIVKTIIDGKSPASS